MRLENQVDVVLLDVRMPDGDGLTALGRIKLDKPDHAHPDALPIRQPHVYRPRGGLGSQRLFAEELHPRAVDRRDPTAATGENTWTREELRRVTGALATPRITADVEVPLTQREGEVLRQLANGLTNKQIAEALQVSYETVKEHVQHILRKIGVSDRTQAAVWAVRKGLV